MTRVAFGLCLVAFLLPGAVALAAIGDDQTPAPQPPRRIPLRLVPYSTFNTDVFAGLEDDVVFLLQMTFTINRDTRVDATSRKGLGDGDDHRVAMRLVEARASYEKVLAAKPDNEATGRAHLGLALTFGIVKDFNSALGSLTQAARLLPGVADVHMAGGLVHMRKNDLKAAIPWLREAVRLDPKYSVHQYWLGFALLHADGSGTEASLAAFREALRLEPDDKTRVGVGMASIKLGYVDDAIAAFEPLVKNPAPNRIAYWFLALAYLNVNRRADAVALVQKLQAADRKPADKQLGDELAKVIAEWK